MDVTKTMNFIYIIKTWSLLVTGADLIYNALRHVNIEIIHAGEQVNKFMDENIKEKIRILAEAVSKNDVHRENLSNKSDDPDWFEGEYFHILYKIYS